MTKGGGRNGSGGRITLLTGHTRRSIANTGILARVRAHCAREAEPFLRAIMTLNGVVGQVKGGGPLWRLPPARPDRPIPRLSQTVTWGGRPLSGRAPSRRPAPIARRDFFPRNPHALRTSPAHRGLSGRSATNCSQCCVPGGGVLGARAGATLLTDPAQTPHTHD